MPRCYMVKKQCSKNNYQRENGWKNEDFSTVRPVHSVIKTEGPSSPTEACVAPPYYNETEQTRKYNKKH